MFLSEDFVPVTYQRIESKEQRHNDVMDAMRHYHKDLADAGVTVALLIASGPRDSHGELMGPAVSHGGYAAKAVVKITNLKDRAAGLEDVVLILDGDHIDEWTDREADAIYDHELAHPVLVLKKGKLVRDDLNRPKLRMRKHDGQFGWFFDVAERHKEHSTEAQQLKEVGTIAVRQGWLQGF